MINGASEAGPGAGRTEARGVSDCRFKKLCPCPKLWVSHSCRSKWGRKGSPDGKSRVKGSNHGFIKGVENSAFRDKNSMLLEKVRFCGKLVIRERGISEQEKMVYNLGYFFSDSGHNSSPYPFL